MEVPKEYTTGYLTSDDVGEGANAEITGDCRMEDKRWGDTLVAPVVIDKITYDMNLNKTNTRKLVKAWGKDTHKWIGKKMKLTTEKIMVKGEKLVTILVEPL